MKAVISQLADHGLLESIIEGVPIHIFWKDREHHFQHLFEMPPDSCWVIDSNNLFSLCNQAAVNMLGYDSIEALSSTHPSKLSPEKQPDGQNSFEKAKEMMSRPVGKHRRLIGPMLI